MFVKTRFYLENSICYSAEKPFIPPTLDGLLGFVWAQEQGLMDNTKVEIEACQVLPELPIVKTEKCYHASSMFLPQDGSPVAVKPLVMARRVVQEEIMAKHDPTRTMPEGQGQFKACLPQFWLITVPYVEFYAHVTDMDEFTRLVNEFSKAGYLGKKAAVGYGHIIKTEIKPVSYDWSVMKDGVATRPLPVSLFQNAKGRLDNSTYYAPYWDVRHKVMCHMPPQAQYTPHIEKQDTLLKLVKSYGNKKEKELKKQEESK